MMIDNPESPLPATPVEREYLYEFADHPEILAAFRFGYWAGRGLTPNGIALRIKLAEIDAARQG